ncbi:Uncharacterized protein Fot_06277 [Forsythia ovata]|uniref:Uncharacterized protein n=1 Tax=Forsythia ovata TaxID=205694 RepID=A0ABD1WSK4_9LAMI
MCVQAQRKVESQLRASQNMVHTKYKELTEAWKSYRRLRICWPILGFPLMKQSLYIITLVLNGPVNSMGGQSSLKSLNQITAEDLLRVSGWTSTFCHAQVPHLSPVDQIFKSIAAGELQ